MAKPLLRNTLNKITYIALLLFVILFSQKGFAQTILLPGDVVVVSVNSDGNSFDFIPLIDVKKGTSIYFSNGEWSGEEQRVDGNSISILVDSVINAGTNVHIGEIDDTRITKNGRIEFDGDVHQLYAYQNEDNGHRLIYGLEWGDIEKRNSKKNVDHPESLSRENHTFLNLGNFQNYQYHIRNGASGTKVMLQKFVGNPANWKGKGQTFFTFGTSFNLLKPPVVLFENSLSTTREDVESATLNVAIYGHDGSKLTVDVYYDSLRSTTDRFDVVKRDTTTLNFTGLVGDGMYEVEIPLTDDNIYEGQETGIFTLANLSGGSFGDFLTHSLIVSDNEIPEVKIIKVFNSTQKGQDFIEIQNQDQAKVFLEGWTLANKKNRYIIDQPVILNPGESIKIADGDFDGQKNSADNKIIYADLKSSLIEEKGGEISLIDISERIIHEVVYSGSEKQNEDSENPQITSISSNDGVNQQERAESGANESRVAEMQKLQDPGWKVLPGNSAVLNDFSRLSFYYWDEPLQRFRNTNEASSDRNSGTSVIGYFDSEDVGELSTLVKTRRGKLTEESVLQFNLSATDRNENGWVDGLEGLNMINNTSDQSIKVHVLLAELERKNPGMIFSSYVYVISENSKNELQFRALSGDQQIGTGQQFWLKLENIQNEKVSFSMDPVSFDHGLIFDEKDTEPEAILELVLSQSSFDEELEFSFNSNNSGSSKLNLNAFPDLYLPSQHFLNFTVHQANEYLDRVEFPYELSQNLALPISFSTSESGSFKLNVTKWEGIPTDWEVSLVDKLKGEEYKLDEDFDLSFDFRSTFSSKEANELPSGTKLKNEERFVLKINPPRPIESETETTDEPKELELYQNFPNPFNPYTTISFYLPEPTEVKLSVFNIVGQPVAVLMEGSLSAGRHQYEWDATEMPSSMYIYQLEVGNRIITRKMTLVK